MCGLKLLVTAFIFQDIERKAKRIAVWVGWMAAEGSQGVLQNADEGWNLVR